MIKTYAVTLSVTITETIIVSADSKAQADSLARDQFIMQNWGKMGPYNHEVDTLSITKED